MKTITGELIDVKNETAEKATIPAELDGYYDAIQCCCITIVSRTIGGRRFDIIADDEGLLKASPKISAIDDLGKPMLVGNLFVTQPTPDGDLRSLTEDECDWVLEHVEHLYTKQYPAGYPMLTQLGY